MKTITFYSYKGGTGRSLALANTAKYLARFGQRVVMLDFDLEAPGLHHKFGDCPWDMPPFRHGLVDYLTDVLADGKPPKSLDKYVHRLKDDLPRRQAVHLMPAGFCPSHDYWMKLSGLNWHDLFYSESPAGVPLFLDLQARIEQELKADYLLIDSRTGITEIGGIATTLLPDAVVCFLLHNPENVLGTRAIIRSIRRARRKCAEGRIEVSAVLSRLPELEADEEAAIVSHTIGLLNDEDDPDPETADVSELFVLHSEPELEVQEALRVGGSRTPETSVLYRDYIRLFVRLIPTDLVRENINHFVRRARNVLWDNPDRAERYLETLASETGLPQAHEALLKFYRLRNADPGVMLRTGAILWNLKQNGVRDLLWDTIRCSFRPAYSHDDTILKFVEDVWRAAGATDVKVGIALAESYRFRSQYTRSADVLCELAERVDLDSKASALCLRMLSQADRTDEADEFLSRVGGRHDQNSDFLAAWIEYALDHKDVEYARQLTANPNVARLTELDVRLAARLYEAVGRHGDALRVADDALERWITRRRGDMETIARVFADQGRSERLREVVQSRTGQQLPDSYFQRF